MLTQETDDGEKVIQYLSKKLSEGQQKWPTIEREAYAIVYTVNKLRHYLLGSKFTVYTDHKPLKSLFTSEMKNARIQRWAIMLEEYGCQVEYKQLKRGVPTRVQPARAANLVTSVPQQWFKSEGEHSSSESSQEELQSSDQQLSVESSTA